MFRNNPSATIHVQPFVQKSPAATLADIRWVEPSEGTDLVAQQRRQKQRLYRRVATRLAASGLGQYLHRLATDYGMAIRDIGMDMRGRPFRTAVIGALLGGLVYTCKTNPDTGVLSARLAQLRQQMVMIPKTIHSTRADECLERYTTLLNGRRLDLVDCWLFTLLVESPFDRNSNFYAARDKTTRSWPWTHLWENTLDVGAFGRFWVLERCFTDSDIHEEEWATSNE